MRIRRKSLSVILFSAILVATIAFIILWIYGTWNMLNSIEFYSYEKRPSNLIPKKTVTTLSPMRITTSAIFNSVLPTASRKTSRMNASKSVFNPRILVSQKNTCVNKSIAVLICVLTDPLHFSYRQSIRHTWGNRNLYNLYQTVAIFFIGIPNDTVVKQILRNEMDLYHDIVQADFIDSYYNLTYKTASIMRWANMYCKHAAFVMKADDDQLINVFRLIPYTKKINGLWPKRKPSIFCYVIENAPVVRNPKSKWYVDKKTYNGSHWPSYCNGPAYLLDMAAVRVLYKAFVNSTWYLNIEDVFFTGILRMVTNVSLVEQNSFFLCKQKDIEKKLLFGDAVSANLATDLDKKNRDFLWAMLQDIELPNFSNL